MAGVSTTVELMDPFHDQQLLKCWIQGIPCSTLPSLGEITRIPRIRKDQWLKRKDRWREIVDSAMMMITPEATPLQRLEEAVHTIKGISTVVLGLTEARIIPLRRARSNAEARLTRQIRLLKTVGQAGRTLMTVLMVEGMHPQLP